MPLDALFINMHHRLHIFHHRLFCLYALIPVQSVSKAVMTTRPFLLLWFADPCQKSAIDTCLQRQLPELQPMQQPHRALRVFCRAVKRFRLLPRKEPLPQPETDEAHGLGTDLDQLIVVYIWGRISKYLT